MQHQPPPPPLASKDKKSFKTDNAPTTLPTPHTGGPSSAASTASATLTAADLLPERPFKDLHHPIIKAIWNVDRFNPDISEKLKELKQIVVVNRTNPSVLSDILHDVTGQPIAQATPLLIACFEGDADVIKFLIEQGADPNQTESEHHLNALHVICDAEYHGQTLRQKDRADIVRMLIRRNANVNHLDRSSMAAIHKAVIHDRPDCVEALMEGRADPNVAYLGDTPLSIAARHNRERICRILLNYKETSVNHRNDQGGTPLHFACAALVDSPACVEMILRAGAKVNVQDYKMNTPLMVCSFFNKPKIMQFLLKEGADPTPRNHEDKDALDVAIEKEFTECKEVLLKALEKFVRVPPNSQKANELAADFDGKTKIR